MAGRYAIKQPHHGSISPLPYLPVLIPGILLYGVGIGVLVVEGGAHGMALLTNFGVAVVYFLPAWLLAGPRKGNSADEREIVNHDRDLAP